jgi:hypothetical protein
MKTRTIKRTSKKVIIPKKLKKWIAIIRLSNPILLLSIPLVLSTNTKTRKLCQKIYILLTKVLVEKKSFQ